MKKIQMIILTMLLAISLSACQNEDADSKDPNTKIESEDVETEEDDDEADDSQTTEEVEEYTLTSEEIDEIVSAYENALGDIDYYGLYMIKAGESKMPYLILESDYGARLYHYEYGQVGDYISISDYPYASVYILKDNKMMVEGLSGGMDRWQETLIYEFKNGEFVVVDKMILKSTYNMETDEYEYEYEDFDGNEITEAQYDSWYLIQEGKVISDDGYDTVEEALYNLFVWSDNKVNVILPEKQTYDVEKEVQQIRDWYYYTQEYLDSFLMGSSVDDITAYYDGPYAAKVTVPSGYLGDNAAKEYFFHDKKVYFIFATEGANEFRYYFKDGVLIRYVDPEGKTYNYGDPYLDEIKERAYYLRDEATELESTMVNCGA